MKESSSDKFALANHAVVCLAGACIGAAETSIEKRIQSAMMVRRTGKV